jgi:hypothetical protein
MFLAPGPFTPLDESAVHVQLEADPVIANLPADEDALSAADAEIGLYNDALYQAIGALPEDPVGGSIDDAGAELEAQSARPGLTGYDDVLAVRETVDQFSINANTVAPPEVWQDVPAPYTPPPEEGGFTPEPQQPSPEDAFAGGAQL